MQDIFFYMEWINICNLDMHLSWDLITTVYKSYRDTTKWGRKVTQATGITDELCHQAEAVASSMSIPPPKITYLWHWTQIWKLHTPQYRSRPPHTMQYPPTKQGVFTGMKKIIIPWQKYIIQNRINQARQYEKLYMGIIARRCDTQLSIRQPCTV